MTQGSPLGAFCHDTIGDGRAFAGIMNRCGYDYVTLGNHDFNFGYDALRAYLCAMDGVCLCALRGQEEDAAFDTDWGVLRMADGENAVFFGEAGRVAAVRRAAGGYLLAEISGDSLSELLSRGLNPAYGVMLLGKQWRLIDDSRTTGSESRLHELRERMLAGEALSDGDAVLTFISSPMWIT